MPALQDWDLGSTRLIQAFEGVHHTHTSVSNPIHVYSYGGVFERARNAYFHDDPAQNKYFLSDPTQPGWLERIDLNGSLSHWFAPPTNNPTIAPTWTQVLLETSTRLTIFYHLEIQGDVHATQNIASDLNVQATQQLISQIATGTPPLVVSSTTLVNNLNSTYINSIPANVTPTANEILPLDVNIKYPNSVLYTGSGNGLDADMVDGKHATFFQAASPNNVQFTYDSGTTYISFVGGSGSGYNTITHTFNHNLGGYPRLATVWRGASATPTVPTDMSHPAMGSSTDTSPNNSFGISFTDANNVVLTGRIPINTTWFVRLFLSL